MVSNQAILRGTQKVGVHIALRGGRKGNGSMFVADWSPYCDNPVRLERRITSRQATEGVKMGNLKLCDRLTSMEVAADVPCRKCAKCLQMRQCQWRDRALQEIITSNRTWWVTLTLSPIHLAGILMAAKSNSLKDVEIAAYRHVQRFLKRLRKGRKKPLMYNGLITHHAFPPQEFRYLAVYERGEKSGRSHYHLFLHEIGSRPVHKLTLEETWPSNVHARLVRSEDAPWRASYLTKYATKSFDIRPRASAGYGKNLFSSIHL